MEIGTSHGTPDVLPQIVRLEWSMTRLGVAVATEAAMTASVLARATPQLVGGGVVKPEVKGIRTDRQAKRWLDASLPHELADLGSLPAKIFSELLLDNQESQFVEGTRTYVRVAKWIAR